MDEYLDFSGSNLVRLQRYLKNIIASDSTLFLGFYFSESLIFLDRTNNQGLLPAFSGYMLSSYVISWDNAEIIICLP